MKKERILLMFIVILAASTTALAQSKNEKKEQTKTIVKELIESENYKIDVNYVMPMRGNSFSATSLYSLEIKNDSIFSYLPYFGRAYRIPYGGGDGLSFKAPIKEYTMKAEKKDRFRINIKARNPEDLYEFDVTVFDNGSANINVNMQNRQSISFRGKLHVPDKD